MCCEAIAFSDSEVLARELAGLALAGHKRAPRRCGVVLRGSGQTPAATGDLRVVTAWNDTTLCVMRSTNEQVTPFDRVPAAWAEAEGEGDG